MQIIRIAMGDVENQRGGVSHIIAGKGFYEDTR
jgi:hypothetical protein